MISTELAGQLKRAGLSWQPRLHDFFHIPDRSLDEQIFVISDLQANLELYRGWPVVTFHGSAEWALDYVLQQDVVWIPLEEQLREQLLERVERLTLTQLQQSCVCVIEVAGEEYSFSGQNGSEVYGEALLFMLLRQGMRQGSN